MSVGVNLVYLLLVVLDILELFPSGQSHLSDQLLFLDPPEFLFIWTATLNTLINSNVDRLLGHHLGPFVGRLLSVRLEESLQLFPRCWRSMFSQEVLSDGESLPWVWRERLGSLLSWCGRLSLLESGELELCEQVSAAQVGLRLSGVRLLGPSKPTSTGRAPPVCPCSTGMVVSL